MSKDNESQASKYAKDYVEIILQIEGEISKQDLIRAFETGYATGQLNMIMEEMELSSSLKLDS